MIPALVLSAALMVPQVIPVLPTDHATERFMHCVAQRESRGDAHAVSRTGKHRGRYQVTPAMRRGMAWHVLPWLATWHPRPRAYAAKLRHTPMNHWPARIQDAAFVLTLHHGGDRWSGWRHWYLAGSRCNGLVPR